MTTSNPTISTMMEVTTAAGLHAILGRSVLLDKDGDMWERMTPTSEYWANAELGQEDTYNATNLVDEYGPLRLVYTSDWENTPEVKRPQVLVDLTKGTDEDGDDSYSLEMNWSGMKPDDLADALGMIVAGAIGRITHNGVSKEIPIHALDYIRRDMLATTLKSAMDYLPATLHPAVAAYSADEDDDE